MWSGTRSERERIPARRSGYNPFESRDPFPRSPGIARLFVRAQGRVGLPVGRPHRKQPHHRVGARMADRSDSRPPNAIRLLKPVLSRALACGLRSPCPGRHRTSRRACSAGRAGCPDTSAAHVKAKGASNANARANARRHVCRRAHGAGSLLAGSRRVHGPSSFGTVRFLGPRRQSLVPARAGHDVHLPRSQGRQGSSRRPHRHRPHEDDRRRHVRRRPRPSLSARQAGRAHDRLVHAGRPGNVWYFGEATAELDASGHVTSTEGSWQAGVAGARPGIYMPAHPRLGLAGRQEFLKGHAEDHFQVLSLKAPSRCRTGRPHTHS